MLSHTEFGGDVADVLGTVYPGEYLAALFAEKKRGVDDLSVVYVCDGVVVTTMPNWVGLRRRR